MRLHDAPVGGDHRAGLEQDQVPGHQLADRDLAGAAVPTTEALGVAIACSEAIARSARYSWRNPIQAFSATTTRITTASVTSPSAAESTPAPISIRIIGEVS